MARQKYPIGIQDFEKIRTQNYLYVDKTAIIHELISEGEVYFLSRPRRFGKSLLVSTLQCIFEGRRELFKGLAIDRLEYDWSPHPVIRLDMNSDKYKGGYEILVSHIIAQLNKNAMRLGVEYNSKGTLSQQFDKLITCVKEKYNAQVAVLVDEYDKPLLETMANKDLHKEMREELKAFYGVLKSEGGNLCFTLLTGVTKFSHVSVFSDLNHLRDISSRVKYASILGVTQLELENYFSSEIHQFASEVQQSIEDFYQKIKLWYNGYCFTEFAETVYNPFSLLNFLDDKRFKNYWFQTGTPTFILDILESSGQNLPELDGYQGGESKLTNFEDPYRNPIPALYQAGYLTIKDYDKEYRLYTLGYPNNEVRYSFLESLSQRFTAKEISGKLDFHVVNFSRELASGNIDAFMERLQNLYARIPHNLNEKKEKYYQTVFYLVFELMGQNIDVEVKTAIGSCDAIVQTNDYVYIIEMKLNGTVADALQQIEDKQYAVPFKYDNRKLFKIGLAFDKEMRTLAQWKVE